jgi:hypothetical protein
MDYFKIHERQEKIKFLEALRSGKLKIEHLKNPEPMLAQVVFGCGPGDESKSIYSIDGKTVSEIEFREAAKNRPASDITKFS